MKIHELPVRHKYGKVSKKNEIKIIRNTICIQTNKMHKILVIRFHFPLDALHVSEYISPSSGTTL